MIFDLSRGGEEYKLIYLISGVENIQVTLGNVSPYNSQFFYVMLIAKANRLPIFLNTRRPLQAIKYSLATETP